MTRSRECWYGVFGMTEMENAAEVILSKSERLGQSLLETDFYPADFIVENPGGQCDRLLTGFVELIYNGWLEKPKRYVYNGGFGVSKGFMDRLSQRGIAYKDKS
jgi:hypothetical protein